MVVINALVEIQGLVTQLSDMSAGHLVSQHSGWYKMLLCRGFLLLLLLIKCYGFLNTKFHCLDILKAFL